MDLSYESLNSSQHKVELLEAMFVLWEKSVFRFSFEIVLSQMAHVLKNIRCNHFMKFMFKLASLVSRKNHVIEIYFFSKF